MENFDDISLMREIQNGNRGAFSVLVARHSKYFFGVAYHFMGTRELAEDILQTAFLKLWERPYKFDCNRENAGFKTWFARMVTNLCRDDHRARRPAMDIDNLEIPDDKTNVADTIDAHRKRVALHLAIKKLSHPQQMAINLGVLNEMPYRDVAKIMNKKEGAIKVLVLRAREKLQINLKEYGYDFERQSA